MNNIHINNSFNIWKPSIMKEDIINESMKVYNKDDVGKLLNRSYISMYIEWWLHNIGFYITKPFIKIKTIEKINLRCRDVDINEWK